MTLLVLAALCVAPLHLEQTPVPRGESSSATADSEVPALQRWPAWVAVVLGAASLVVGAVFQGQSIMAARALDNRGAAPGDWADTARLAHTRAMQDAGLATSLF